MAMVARLSLMVSVAINICCLNAWTLRDDCSGEDVYKCDNKQCISQLAVCDGTFDCINGSDEDFCDNHKVSQLKCDGEAKYMCKDRKMCITYDYVCDGSIDCEDGSDEDACATETIIPINPSCRGHMCKDDHCISLYWLCDGQPDCKDLSDEDPLICLYSKAPGNVGKGMVRLCPDGQNRNGTMFYCKDRSHCLDWSEVCDGLHDCRDSSDEGLFCTNWTSQCVSSKCEEGCVPTPTGPRCRCGAALVSANSSCTSYDPCIGSPCSQLCKSGGGKYSCSCAPGYRADGNMCYAAEGDPILFYTTQKEIRRHYVKSERDDYVTSANRPHSVCYDGTYMYWIEMSQGNHNVMRANVTSVDETKEVLLGIGLDEPDDLAVDWLGHNLYLTESKHSFIGVCTTDGAVCKRLRDVAGIRRPRLITLNPEAGLMYWADFIQTPRIQRAKMDGTAIATLTATRTYPPAAITIDAPARKIYWAERNVGISVINFDGTGKYEFLGRFIHTPNSLTVFENDLYWNDHSMSVMQTSSKMEGEARRKKLFKSKDHVTDVTLFHPLLQRDSLHTCEHSLCSDMCIITGDLGYTCLCAEDATLAEDKHTCIRKAPQNYLLVANGNVITKVYFHALTKPEKVSVTLNVGRIQALAYNPREETVYVYDAIRRVVYKLYTKLFEEGVKDLLHLLGVEEIVDMSYDYVTDNLFYLDVGPLQSKLAVHSAGTSRTALVHGFLTEESPISLCVMPEYGTLMVAIYNTTDGEIKVDRFAMDGSNRQNVYQTRHQGSPVSVRYSKQEDKVYIADPARNLIYEIHPEGTGGDSFRRIRSSVLSMAVAHKVVFWSDAHTPRLYWADVDDHANTMGSMMMNKSASWKHLHLVSVMPSTNASAHPCLSGHACAHVCVQAAAPAKGAACLCPAGQAVRGPVCEPRALCKAGQLRCYDSNTCYDRRRRCDNVLDCPKGEDERDCADDPVCGPDEYNCPGTATCIARHQVCDGHKDCPDRSDEESRQCPTKPCQADQYTCQNGVCVMSTWVCDGEKDCPDGSDEVHCVNTTCELGNFHCRDGPCIEIRMRCDGSKDCLDWSDEEGCEDDDNELPEVNEVHCADNQYSCPTNRSICLDEASRCDGVADCPERIDEIDCAEFSCAPGHYECRNGQQCVPKADICNKKNDCYDGSDESKTACVFKKLMSPEEGAVVRTETSYCSGVRCDASNKCVDVMRLCDGYSDCRDGADEGAFCGHPCAPHMCHHECKPTPRGPHCYCHAGYTLEALTNTCRDVDECEGAVCSHVCTNTVGSYVCSCHYGYALRSDRRSCKSILSGNATVMYLSGDILKEVRPHEGVSKIIYANNLISHINHFDYDPVNNMTYISTEKELLGITTDGSVLNMTNIGVTTWVGADWITGNIFVVDATPYQHRIRVCHMEKELCATMYNLPNYTEITSFTVDPKHRRMFYCEWQMETRRSVVFVASLVDGGDRVALRAVHNCTGLAADHHKRILYVAESNARIRKMNYDGTNSIDVIINNEHLRSPLGLQLYEDHLYSIDSHTLKITRCLTFGLRTCEPHVYRVLRAKDLVLKHENAKFDAERHCADACEGSQCRTKPECLCYFGLMEERDYMCVHLPESAFVKVSNGHAPDVILMGNGLTVLSVMSIVIGFLFIGCLYLCFAQHEAITRILQPISKCCSKGRVRRERVVANAQPSWQSSPSEDTSDLGTPPSALNAIFAEPSPSIEIRSPTLRVTSTRTHSSSNTSFLNWVFSSFNKKARRRQQNEPSVALHLNQPIRVPHKEVPVSFEPQPGTSGLAPPIRTMGSPSGDSDTESEKDGRI